MFSVPQIIRLREEGSRQLEEQQRLVREQIRLEREQHSRGELRAAWSPHLQLNFSTCPSTTLLQGKMPQNRSPACIFC